MCGGDGIGCVGDGFVWRRGRVCGGGGLGCVEDGIGCVVRMRLGVW